MAELTEREILSCLTENLRLASENAHKLANGERGKVYLHFRDNLALIYGCCRQMSGWREDTRWSPFGVYMKEAQERCRKWLVIKMGPGNFRKLAAIMDAAIVRAKELETKKTGRRGIILPTMRPGEIRTQGRPVSMSGLILPPGFGTLREAVN